MPRLWVLCDYCQKPFNMLPRHWSQSRCGPATAAERKAAIVEARARAFSLTRTAAVVTNEELDHLRLQADPLQALCLKLGVVVAETYRGKEKTAQQPAKNAAHSPDSGQQPALPTKVSVQAIDAYRFQPAFNDTLGFPFINKQPSHHRLPKQLSPQISATNATAPI